MIPDPIQRLDDPPEPTAAEWEAIETIGRNQDSTTSCGHHGATIDLSCGVRLDVIVENIPTKCRKEVTR